MDINFKSFSLSPSDHECQEGDLATVKNLVYDDGALKPVFAPKHGPALNLKVTVGGVTTVYSPEDTKFYVHEVDTDSISNSDHKNYIAIVSNTTTNKVLWCNDTEAGTLTWAEIGDLSGFKVNAITFTGRIINLIGDTEQRWAMWKGDSYQVVTLDDFKYNLKIHSEPSVRDGAWVLIGSEYTDIMDIQYANSGTEYESMFDYGSTLGTIDENTQALGLSSAGIKAILDGLDADLKQKISNDETLHRHISFGFAAIRLYDGQHIMLSDLFVLGGRSTWSTISIRLKSSDGLKANATSNLHKHTIAVSMDNIDNLSSLIQGVDIYVSTPSMFKDYNKAYRFESPVKIKDGSSHDIAVTLDNLNDKDMYAEVDNMSFHRALFITREEIGTSTQEQAITLKATDETDSAITLADFYRSKHGAKAATNYNGRLNLGDVTEALPLDDTPEITYTFGKNFWPTNTEFSGFITWNSINVPASYDSTTEIATLQSADVIMGIDYVDSFGAARKAYTKRNMAMPLPPIIMLPIQDVTSIELAIHEKTAGAYSIASDIKPHFSETGNLSYFLHRRNNLVSFWSRLYYTGSSGSTMGGSSSPTPIDGGEFNTKQSVTPQLYAALDTKHTNGPTSIIYRYMNRVAVSEADNPFVFKATNRISVGNGSVLALAAPTQPISQGQAGQTPLVAFTSEGIYPLYINTNDGSLAATQPGPRDVLTNPDAVLSIDDAIVFPTARGLMLYSGSQTKCITDSLRGNLFPGALPHLDNMLGNSALTHKIANYAPLTNLESFLTSCQLLYNYVDQQIIVFNTSSSKALVFSLRTGAWGAMDYDFMSALNSYPEALAIGKESGNYFIVDAHNSNPPESTAFNLITRPLALGEPDTLKRISAAIVRGYFQKGHVKTAVYGSRDLVNWNLINTSTNHYLRGRMGSPYKYFRVVALGYLGADETIYGVSLDASGSLINQMR